MKIIKRDGTQVEFDASKIINAITKANNFMDIDDAISPLDIEEIAVSIQHLCEKSKKPVNVEDIQDMVENKLMDLGRHNLARTYMTYRYKHAMARDNYGDLMDEVKKRLEASDVKNQNANVDERSFSGRTGEVDRLVLQRFALENCMSETTKRNHLNNEVYTHDLDSYASGMHNCLTLPIDKLLENGFTTRQGDVRPANSINTACQLVAVLFQLQSLEQFGGVAASHIDWSMVPYVRKSFFKHYKDGVKYIDGNDEIDYSFQPYLSIEEEDYKIYSPKAYEYAMDMTVKEIYQAVEGLYHNLNTLQSRSGGQLPFSSINYGTCTLLEGRLFTKALLDVSIEGIGKLRKTPIYPCGIFQSMKGVNRKPGDKNYDLFQLALKSTAKRLYPNYGNCSWSGNAGFDPNDPKTYFATMGKCKLQLI